jgi:hypothetical protein
VAKAKLEILLIWFAALRVVGSWLECHLPRLWFGHCWRMGIGHQRLRSMDQRHALWIALRRFVSLSLSHRDGIEVMRTGNYNSTPTTPVGNCADFVNWRDFSDNFKGQMRDLHQLYADFSKNNFFWVR